jgi:hypothetical protein
MWFETKVIGEEQRLLAEYTEATSCYAKAARQLEKRRAAASSVEYQSLIEICEDERGACEDTRLALEALRAPLLRASDGYPDAHLGGG